MKKTLFTITVLLSMLLVACGKKDDPNAELGKKDDFGDTEIQNETDYKVLFPDNAVDYGKAFINELLWLDDLFDKTTVYKYEDFEKYDKKEMNFPLLGKVTIDAWTANSPALFNKTHDFTLKNKVRDFYLDKVKEMIQLRKDLGTTATPASRGKLGYIGEDDGQGGVKNPRYVNSQGLELAEVLQKQAMGIILLDQIVNNHLSDKIMKDSKLRRENKDRKFLEGKRYTELEYRWDLAYALLGTDSRETKPQFLANYLTNQYHGAGEHLTAKVYLAFKEGRKALAKADYTTVEKSIETIRESLSVLFSRRAVYYLSQAKPNIESTNDNEVKRAFHNLSETYGFISTFVVTRKANGDFYVPREEYSKIEEMLKDFLGTNGFWDTERLKADENTKGSLENIAKRIGDIYGFNYKEVYK